MTPSTDTASLLRMAPPAGSRIAVVGGCGGIGRVVVAALAVAGAEVAVLDLARSLDAHPVPDGVVGIEIDASNENAVARAFDALNAGWGGLDCTINLCGYQGELNPVDEISPDGWDESIAANLRSAYLIARNAIPLMKTAGRGTLVMVSSGLGVYGGVNFGAYAAAKGGINALVKTIAKENAPIIRANVVAPSYVETGFAQGGPGNTAANTASPIDVESYTRSIPLRRIADATDIVGPILFLAGPASGYMTGQVLHVNGGSFTP